MVEFKARTTIDRLKTIREQQRKKVRRRAGSRPMTKRVDLGRVNNSVPTIVPYPFMVDEFWHTDFVVNKGLTLDTHEKDPEGFGGVFNNDEYNF